MKHSNVILMPQQKVGPRDNTADYYIQDALAIGRDIIKRCKMTGTDGEELATMLVRLACALNPNG